MRLAPIQSGILRPARVRLARARSFRAFVASTLLAWCPSAFALNPTLPVTESGHTVWKRGDAFSSGIVEAIAQTPDGHFWLGSSTGLIRFDGAAKSHSMVRLRRSILGRTRAAPSRTLLATDDPTENASNSELAIVAAQVI
jgi:hypothetical protein